MYYYTYILANNTNTTIYTGVTNDLIRRVYEHKNDFVDGFTKRYRVHKLVYYEVLGSAYDAITREKQIKSWRRRKKNDLVNSMNPQWVDLYESIL